MNMRRLKKIFASDLGILIILAITRIILHTLTNHNYGFHRDELATLDNARHLAWGYVAYPPLTPFLGRIGMILFGTTTTGVRFISSLAQGAALVLVGLMVRELSGKRWAVVIAGLAMWIAPASFAQGALFQYVSFDYLWWVLAAFFMIRLLKSEDPRWWLGIGAASGLGMMTKYTMGFFAVGIAGSVLLTPARKYLKSRWLWSGVGLALLIYLPNFLWQVQHNFISIQHLNAIHAHDVQIGRANDFLIQQLLLGVNPFMFPLWLIGLYYYLFTASGHRYRGLGWMYLITLVSFMLAKGRGYYVFPAYPMLLAAGIVVSEGWLSLHRQWVERSLKGVLYLGMVCGGILVLALTLPAAPMNSAWWNFASSANTDLKEEIGWPDLVDTVAHIYHALPEQEKPQTGIFTNNYGEAGAINLFGPDLGLPTAISGVNSYWLRGYGDPPSQTLVVIGYMYEDIASYFQSCSLAGQITNRYSVQNEETKVPNIYICRGLRESWEDFWQHIHHFG